MMAALRRLRRPDRNAAFVPGRLTSSSFASERVSSAIARVSPSTEATSRGGELIEALGHLGRTLRRAPFRGAAADQLGDRGVLAAAGIGLDPVPRGDRPGQLIVAGARVPVVVTGPLGELAQDQASRRGIERLTGPEPRSPAGVHAGKDPVDPGIPGPRRPQPSAVPAARAAVRPSRPVTAASRS
jgi:hypothetical protein